MDENMFFSQLMELLKEENDRKTELFLEKYLTWADENKKYEFYIITTRSHRKLKNDLISDRFRVFLHLDSTINDALTYDNFMKTTVNQYPFIDSKATDKGRFFFSSPVDALVFYNEGKKYPVLIVDPTIKKTLQGKKEIKPSNYEGIYIFNELQGLWIDENGNVTTENTGVPCLTDIPLVV